MKLKSQQLKSQNAFKEDSKVYLRFELRMKSSPLRPKRKCKVLGQGIQRKEITSLVKRKQPF